MRKIRRRWWNWDWRRKLNEPLVFAVRFDALRLAFCGNRLRLGQELVSLRHRQVVTYTPKLRQALHLLDVDGLEDNGMPAHLDIKADDFPVVIAHVALSDRECAAFV